MYFYFLSEYPAVIKLNGIYFGQIYPDAKSIDIDLSKPTFVEICSMKKNQPSANFIIDDNFTKNFDAHASLTDLDGGFFIKFLLSNKKSDTFLLAQERFSDLAVSVFNQDGLKVSIESANDFYADDINGEYISAKISKFFLDGKELLLICLEENEYNLLLVYDYSPKINRLFYDKINSFSLENGFSTTYKYKDVLKHEKTVFWKYENNCLAQKQKKISAKKVYSKDAYHQNIIPFIFMEELLIGGDVAPFLTEEIYKDRDNLLPFFGDVIGVMPPPIFKDQSLIGLVYKSELNRYFVKYAELSLTDKLISNIKII